MASKFDHIFEFFDRTSDQFFSKEEFMAKLRSGKKMRIKYGVDVTAPTLHIGHAVNLWLMRYLQDMGHKVVFLIGDFTTRIGDPTGRSDARPIISRADIDKNADEFIKQAKMVLRFDDPNLLEIRRNSEWYDKMPVQELMELLAQVTQARLISRDMFQMRIEEGKEIHMHEMIYPVLQGWDSVMVQSDITIIGSDQLFNEMMGRHFQERKGKKPQTIITTKITPGIDGKAKQSKSIGNYIGLAHSPRDKFGRVMSIPDDLIDTYFRVYTDVPLSGIDMLAHEVHDKPREAKIKLAYAIVGRYHGHDIAAEERDWFIDTFSKGKVPEDIPVVGVMRNRMPLIELVALARKGKSKSDSRRLIKQGAVEINGIKHANPDKEIFVDDNDILKVGKRSWYRVQYLGLNELATERLQMTAMQVEDIDFMVKYIPEWEMAKYLGKPSAPKKVVEEVTRQVLQRIIASPDPKNEWLWRISLKTDPHKVVGMAHLRKDTDLGNENIWIDANLHDQGLMQEAVTALNEHAFNVLNFQSLRFHDAFSHAAAPQELDALLQTFSTIDSIFQNRDDPTGIIGFTKEGWEQIKEDLEKNTPNAYAVKDRRSKKKAEQKAEQKITEKQILSKMAAQFQGHDLHAPKPPEPEKPKPVHEMDLPKPVPR